MYAQYINGIWKELYGNILFSDTIYQTAETLTDEQRREFNVYLIVDTPRPDLDNFHKYGAPTFTILDNEQVKRVYEILEKTQEELDIESAAKASEVEYLRKEAYRNESDPLFFKWQRGEIDKQVWLDKVAEIKDTYK